MNERRRWPDWRLADLGERIEHADPEDSPDHS
jgi:hypothetical protein